MSTQQRLEFYPVRQAAVTYTGLLSLADAKAHLKVEHDDEDDLITALIETALLAIENMTGQLLGSTSCHLIADSWQSQAFTFGPITRVDAVKHYDETNTLVELPAANYWVDIDSTPARITFSAPPSIYSDRHQGVRIECIAGHASLPKPLRQAALLLIGHYYEHRQLTSSLKVNDVPMAVDFLVNPFRLFP